MSRGWDERSESNGGVVLHPFWRTRRGKIILLAVFIASIAAGFGIGLLLRQFGFR